MSVHCRYLHDLEGVSAFASKRLESAALTDAGADEQLYSSDGVVGMLMEELQRRRERNTAELKALYRWVALQLGDERACCDVFMGGGWHEPISHAGFVHSCSDACA